MKVLLAAINAKYIHSNLAVYSLKAYADRALGKRAEIVIREYTINQEKEELLADIYGQNPEVLAFSCYIWNIVYVRDLVFQIRTLLPKTDIWLGGPEVSYEPQGLLAGLPVKGIMLGEGEEVFTRLLLAYLDGEKPNPQSMPESLPTKSETRFMECLRAVRGIACREFMTEPGEPLTMDELPFVYEDFSDEQFQNRIPYYETSRGCPFRCTYCLSSIEKRVRYRSLPLVKQELQFFLDKKVPQVKLVDRTFNCDPSRAVEIWKYLKEHDNGITNFHFEIAADIMTQEEISLIGTLRPGLIRLEIGVQTTNTETLGAICRRMDFKKVSGAVKQLLAKKNVLLHLDLIAGLLKEDFLSFQNSFNEVYALHPDELQLGFLKVLKGTPIETEAEKGTIRCWTTPPYEVLSTDWLSFDKLLILKAVEEMVELYYNSGQFSNTIAFLEGYFETPFALYEALAEHYRQKGYGTVQPSRIRRYEILLEFAEGLKGMRIKACREYLTLDLYLREKLKKRPDFSEPQELYREQVQEFYKKEEKNRTYLPEYAEYDFKQLMRLTHIEVFDAIGKERQALLFNYRAGDGLTANAGLITVTKELEGMEKHEETDKRDIGHSG